MRIVAAMRDQGVDAGTRRTPRPSSETATPTITQMDSPTSSTSGSTAACTHVFKRWKAANGPDQRWPADLYLERLRPVSRLVPVVIARKLRTRGRAPFDAV